MELEAKESKKMTDFNCQRRQRIVTNGEAKEP
jgi:hypothetical protein